MVMDQLHAPSAQCVGQEFVRQYYTLLNEAPHYLHRFYSNSSSFLHGGDEKPGEEPQTVTGQADIHRKILALNFQRCHAKIRQVDSQPSTANSVVVQVTGELSNNGEPMRRFMQTFVLAPQTPKKFYVHNDIFRYQDEVFYDTDEDEVVDEMPTEMIQDGSVSSGVMGYPGIDPHMQQLASQMVMPPQQPEVRPPTQTQVNQPMIGGQHMGNGQASQRELEMVGTAAPEPAVEEPEPEVHMEPEEPQFEDALEIQEPEAPKKPSSWAGVLAGNGSQPAPPPSALKPAAPPAKPAVKPDRFGGNKEEFGQGPKPPRDARPPRVERPERDSVRPQMGGDMDFNRGPRYPDSQQLFVGNLPHNVPDKELKDFFEKYGKVVDLRINRKANRDVPNFGFIVFEEADVVSKILRDKPIMFRGEHRLNVEEKKARGETMPRPSSGTRPTRGGPNGNGPMRGNVRGGRGGMRSERGTSERGPSERGRGGPSTYGRM